MKKSELKKLTQEKSAQIEGQAFRQKRNLITCMLKFLSETSFIVKIFKARQRYDCRKNTTG